MREWRPHNNARPDHHPGPRLSDHRPDGRHHHRGAGPSGRLGGRSQPAADHRRGRRPEAGDLAATRVRRGAVRPDPGHRLRPHGQQRRSPAALRRPPLLCRHLLPRPRGLLRQIRLRSVQSRPQLSGGRRQHRHRPGTCGAGARKGDLRRRWKTASSPCPSIRPPAARAAGRICASQTDPGTARQLEGRLDGQPISRERAAELHVVLLPYRPPELGAAGGPGFRRLHRPVARGPAPPSGKLPLPVQPAQLRPPVGPDRRQPPHQRRGAPPGRDHVG